MRFIAFSLTFVCNVVVGATIVAIGSRFIVGGNARLAIGVCVFLMLIVSLLLAAAAALFAGMPFMREMRQPLPLIAHAFSLSVVGAIADIGIVLIAKSFAN